MQQFRWIKAGLLGTALLALAAPVIAQPDGGRPPRGDRGGGGGFNRPTQSAAPAQRPDFGGQRGGDRGGWGGGDRPAPSAQQAPQQPRQNWQGDGGAVNRDTPRGRDWSGGRDRPSTPVVQPVPGAQQPAPQPPRQTWQGGSSGGMNRDTPRAREDRRDGGRDWTGDRGRPDTRPAPVVQPVPGAQPPRQNWQGGNGGSMNRDDRRDRNDRDWNRDRDRDRDRPNWNNGNNGNNGNWNDRDRRDNRNWNDNRWRYDASRRFNDRDRWNDFRRWDNNQWRRDQRYNWQYWRNSHRDVYRLPRYTAPYGWSRGYSRFSIGIFIDSFWFGSSYWLDDPYRYRLPPAYGSLRWIRYYNDALLVDIRDGYVVDTVYDVFW